MDSASVIRTTDESHEGLVMSRSLIKPASLEKAFIVLVKSQNTCWVYTHSQISFEMDARATGSHPLLAECANTLDIQRAREALVILVSDYGFQDKCRVLASF
ncbi:hypothetical protein AMTRI_Chr09g19040 [Amborella trichopoda]